MFRPPHAMSKALAVLLLLLLALPGDAAGRTVWLSEDLPPFNFLQDGAFTGIVPDILAEIAPRAGVPFDPAQVQVMPWTRAYQSALSTPGAAIFSMARTPERDGLFSWVGPLCTVRLGLVAKKSLGLNSGSPAAGDGLAVGTVRDSASERCLLQQGRPERVERSLYRLSCARMLAAGRIQAWAYNVPTALFTLCAAGENPADYEEIGLLQEVDFYLAFSPGADPAVVRSLQAELENFKKTPPYQAILDRHFGRLRRGVCTQQAAYGRR